MTADNTARATRLRYVEAVKTAIMEGFEAPSKANGSKPGKSAYHRAAEMLGVRHHKIAEVMSRARKAGEEPDWQDIARRAKAADLDQPWLERPKLPSGDVPIGELIEALTQRSERLLGAHAARSWFKVKVHADGPFGVAWLGDPHLDSPGCNWKLLRRDIEVIRRTDGMFAANCGELARRNSRRRPEPLSNPQELPKGRTCKKS